MKEIQQLEATVGKRFERTTLRIENPDSGTFIWTFKNPKTDKYIPTEKISVNATASQMRSAVYSYFNSVKSSDISVTRYQMDEDGNNCSCSNKTVHTNIYEITLLRLITDVTFTTSIVTKFGSQSVLTVVPPS